jgi:uncharacterized protein YegP (UPF0339 family)
MPRSKFKVRKGKDGQFYVRLQAANHEPVAVGEGYTSKDGALKGVEAIVDAVADMVEAWTPGEGLLLQEGAIEFVEEDDGEEG